MTGSIQSTILTLSILLPTASCFGHEAPRNLHDIRAGLPGLWQVDLKTTRSLGNSDTEYGDGARANQIELDFKADGTVLINSNDPNNTGMPATWRIVKQDSDNHIIVTTIDAGDPDCERTATATIDTVILHGVSHDDGQRLAFKRKHKRHIVNAGEPL